jgi:hypothetical protein
MARTAGCPLSLTTACGGSGMSHTHHWCRFQEYSTMYVVVWGTLPPLSQPRRCGTGVQILYVWVRFLKALVVQSFLHSFSVDAVEYLEECRAGAGGYTTQRGDHEERRLWTYGNQKVEGTRSFLRNAQPNRFAGLRSIYCAWLLR